MEKRKIAVAVSGASGAIYAELLLNTLAQLKESIDTSLVYTSNAKTVWKEERQNEHYDQYDFPVYEIRDYYAPFASGSSTFDTLVIVPCSMGTLGRIAGGISDNLITRAADVMLKERRRLICVIRETPYNLVHIHNMKTVTEAGGIICPASPSFYSRPPDMEALAMTVVHRILRLADIDAGGFKWGEK
ncbi:MAG: UbiX family flavin prenyltransferase [Taibaiella sp.]|nr:UbiX family flavin prenyltransferase [Taibaiella sp.]